MCSGVCGAEQDSSGVCPRSRLFRGVVLTEVCSGVFRCVWRVTSPRRRAQSRIRQMSVRAAGSSAGFHWTGDAFRCVSAAAASSLVCESRVLSVPVPHLL